MNACSIKGTPYEKEYRTQIGLSEPAMIFVWNANKEQPIDKRKVGNEVIDNPLYKALLEHPITGGDRIRALKLVAQSLLPTFTKQYSAQEDGYHSLEQVVEYVEKQRKQRELQNEQLKESINIPTSMAINIPMVEGLDKPVFFSPEQGQDIYDTIQYLLGESKSWDKVYEALTTQRNVVLARVQAGFDYTRDLEQLAYTEMYFTDIFWPDFNAKALQQSLEWYKKRERRFGQTGLQVLENTLVKNA
jgi:hypothetical protein